MADRHSGPVGRRAAHWFAEPDGERAGGHAGRGAPQREPDQPVWAEGSEPRADLRLCGNGGAADPGGGDPGVCHPSIPVYSGEVPDFAGGVGEPVQRHGQGQQPPPVRVFKRLHLRRGRVHLCGYAL